MSKYTRFNLIFGALSGLSAGLIFFIVLSTTNFRPQMLYMRVLDQLKIYQDLAFFFQLSKDTIADVLHFITATSLGIFFAFLFSRLVKNFWMGLGVGCIFGVVWWLLTPFYILPFLFLVPKAEEWKLISAFTLLSSLVGHVLFGTLIGLFFGIFKQAFGPKEHEE